MYTEQDYFKFISKVAGRYKMIRSQTVQYFHDQNTKFTAAVNIDFNRYDLEDLVCKEDRSIKTDIGIACCHPNDNYDKKIGRTTAFDNMKEVILRLNSIQIDHQTKKLVYMLQSDDGNYHLDIRTCLNSEKPHLIGAYATIVYDKKLRGRKKHQDDNDLF